MSGLVAAVIAVAGSGSAAEAQLWKPKKKPAVTVKKPAPRKAARVKKPVRKKPSSSSVVKFGPPRDREVDRGRASDDEVRPDPVDEVDDDPRISVYDGDRDE